MHTSETLSPWRPFQLNLFYMWLCFRLYPLATMNCRILSEDIVLDGYLIPKEVKLHKWLRCCYLWKVDPHCADAGFSHICFRSSHQPTTGLSVNTTKYPEMYSELLLKLTVCSLSSIISAVCTPKFYENPPMTSWVILLTDKQRAIITVPPLKAVLLLLCVAWWCNGSLACDSRGRELNSRPFRCQVTTLGKLFTHMCLSHQAV